MPILKDQRQETFAQQIASGAKPAVAAQVAGCKEVSAPSQASRWLRNAKVAQRIAELREVIAQRAVEKAAVDKAYVVTRLQQVAERCLQERAVTDRKGNPVLIETPTGEIAAAFTFDSAGANRALELLGKEFGVGVAPDNSKERPRTALDDLSNDEIQELIRYYRQMAGLPEAPAKSAGQTLQ